MSRWIIVSALAAGLTALASVSHALEKETKPSADCRADAASLMAQHFSGALQEAMPIAKGILSEHHVRAAYASDGAHYRVDVELGDLRDVEVPHPDAHEVRYLTEDITPVYADPRSNIDPLWKVYENTVLASDLAYEITFDYPDGLSAAGVLNPGLARRALPHYTVKAVYADAYSGFAGVALEYAGDEGLGPHRIYAVAGSHVFYHTDLRTWASGLTMGRAQFVSTGALQMIRDAAEYAAAGSGGGEVFVTGQSQGGLTSQGVGYLIQAYIDSKQHRGHHLVHVVSWGAIGALESIVRMIETDRLGERRGFPESLERHWSHTEPHHHVSVAVWDSLSRHWTGVEPGGAHAHVMETAGRMGSVGFFFDIDLFARAGTFIGPTLAFPAELLIPGLCEQLVAEREAGVKGGTLGVELEGHFLNGYERAIRRGGLALARPVEVVKWEWVIDMLPTFEAIGGVWLTQLYEDRIGATAANWGACESAGEWRTNQNGWCEKLWWQGCGPGQISGWEGFTATEKPAAWCLITAEE